MKFKTVVNTKKFWPSVFFLALGFIIIYNGVDLIFSYKFNFSAYFSAKFASGVALRFIVANLIGGFIYGFIVAFLQFRSKLKRAQNNQQ